MPPAAPTTFETPIGQRVRFLSCTTDPLGSRPPSAPALDMEEDVFPTKDSSASGTHIPPSSTSQTPTPTPLYHSTPLSSLPPPTRILRDEHKENTPPYAEGRACCSVWADAAGNAHAPDAFFPFSAIVQIIVGFGVTIFCCCCRWVILIGNPLCHYYSLCKKVC